VETVDDELIEVGVLEFLKVALEVRLGRLTAGADGHGVVLVAVARGRKFVKMRAGRLCVVRSTRDTQGRIRAHVGSGDEEADTVRPPSVVLGIDLRL
jgi:hypothetical protein